MIVVIPHQFLATLLVFLFKKMNSMLMVWKPPRMGFNMHNHFYNNEFHYWTNKEFFHESFYALQQVGSLSKCRALGSFY